MFPTMQDTSSDRVTGLENAGMSRRRILQGIVAAMAPAVMGSRAQAAQNAAAADPGSYSAAVLPQGVRSRFVPGVNGLRVHMLEAGFETPGRQAVLLLH